MRRLLSLFNVLSAGLLVLALLATQAVQRVPPAPEAPKLQLAQRTAVSVKVYYTDSQVQRVLPETRTVQVTQRTPTAIAQATLGVWAAGPAQSGHLAAIPAGTAAPKVYLRGAHYFVDLPSTYGTLRYGASGHRMLLCTITRTLLDARGQDVTFLLGGQDVETLGQMDLREPYTRQDCADQ